MTIIKVGEYVRTDKGEIAKVSSVAGETFEDVIGIGFQAFNTEPYVKGNVIKHSSNIIDLIEVGDIVETFDVLHNDIVYIWNEEMLKALKEDIENGIGIKSIVTKERFKNSEYVIGG